MCFNHLADHCSLVGVFVVFKSACKPDVMHRTLETVYTIFAWMYLYRLTVTFYGTRDMLQGTHWTLNTSVIFEGVIGAIVQARFHQRINLLRNSLTLFCSLTAHTGYT